MLGVEEEPHLLTVLVEKMSAVKQLQTLSEDMSGWLSGSKQGSLMQACMSVVCACMRAACEFYVYLLLIEAADPFTEKQMHYVKIGES